MTRRRPTPAEAELAARCEVRRLARAYDLIAEDAVDPTGTDQSGPMALAAMNDRLIRAALAHLSAYAAMYGYRLIGVGEADEGDRMAPAPAAPAGD